MSLRLRIGGAEGMVALVFCELKDDQDEILEALNPIIWYIYSTINNEKYL